MAQSDELFRVAVEASPSGMVMVDAEGTIVLVNAETERLFGYARVDLLGKPIDVLIPERFRDRHGHHRDSFAAQPEARRMGVGRDLYARRKDGSEFPVEIGLNPVQTAKGTLVLGAIVDISERRCAESRLQRYKEREQLYFAAVESSRDAIVTKTLEGVITGWNQAAERLFGYTALEAVGAHIELIVPDDRRNEIHDLLRRIGRGETVASRDTVRVAKDGRRIDVSISISPVKSEFGEIVGAAKIARDITEMKRVQQTLRDSEQMARGIIDSSLDAFVQLDESGVIIDWNRRAEAMYGWSREEALGQDLGRLILPSAVQERHAERVSRFLEAARTQTFGIRFEELSLRRDGSEFMAEVAVTALKLQNRYVFNGFVRDLTKKIAADAQLRQSQKMDAIGQLTGGVAHDFNNILTVIIGANEMILEAVAGCPELVEAARNVDQAAERGAQLTTSLLAYARQQPLQPREADVDKIISGTMKFLRPTLGEQIEIESRLASATWRAFVDPSQLETVLLNLALNARDAMPNGGKLVIETDRVELDEDYARANFDAALGPYVMIAVSDTGSGIPAAIRDRVFEPFFTTKETGKGTGLGLSMAYGFIKQSGGHIKIYSEEGHGTTIRLYLPRADRGLGDVAAETPSAAVVGGNEAILVVEDDAMVRGHATAQLRSLGYSVVAAASAQDALAIVDSEQPIDLLFTDVIMPGSINGRELSEIARTRRSSLKVLFTSGYTENILLHRGRLDPDVLLLPKPYHKVDLARMIRAALSTGG